MADKWLFTDEELKRSPSRLAGMSKDEEMANRVNAASLIQEIGDKLTINQLSTNTGIVYMHRFYMKCSFQKFNYTTMSAACLFLAAKVEDQPRKLEYVAKVLNNYNAKQRHSEVNHPSPNSAQEVRDLVEEIAFDEEILLQVLGLQTTVDHPHSQIVNSCAMLKASKEISHSSYVFASTSLVVTTMCLRFPSTVIACVCINIALRWGGFEIKKTSEGKLWYNYVDPTMTLEKLEALSNELASAIEKYPKNLLKRKGVGAKIAGLGPVFSNHPSKNHHHHHKQPHIPSSHPSQKLPTNVRPPNHPFSHHRPSNQTNGNSAAKTTSVPSTTSTITTTTSNASTMSDTTTTATTTTTTTPVVNKMPKLINMQEYKERKQKELKEQQLKIQQQQKEQEIRQEQLKAQQQLKIQQEQEQLKAQQQEQLKIQQQQQQQLKMQQQQQQQLKMQHQQKEQQLKAQQHKEQQHKLQKEQLQPNQQQRELLKQQQNQLIKQQLSKQPLPQQPKDKPRLSTQQLQRPPSSQQKWPQSTSQHTSTSTTRHSLSLNTSLPNLPSLPVQLPIPTSLDVIQHTTTINQPRPSHPISAVTATTTITTSKTFNPLEANVKKHKALSTLLQAEAAKNQQKKLVESAASKAAVSTLNSSINSGSSLNRSMVSNHSKIPETTPRSSNILVNSNNISEIIKSVSSQPFSHHQSSHSEHHHHHPEHHHHTSSHHHQSSNHHHHRDSEHRHSKKHHKEKKKHHHKHHKSKEESKRKHHEDSSLPPIKFKLSNPPVSPPPSESSDLKLKIKDLPNYVVSKDNQSASLSSFQPSLNKEPIKLKISKDKGGHYINPNQSAKSLIEAKKRKHPMDQNGLNIKMPRTDNNDLYPPSI